MNYEALTVSHTFRHANMFTIQTPMQTIWNKLILMFLAWAQVGGKEGGGSRT